MIVSQAVAAAGSVLGAVFNMDQPGRYLHWWFIQISVANVVVIALMVIVFLAAVFVPFPHRRNRP